ncbi:zinc ribbon domain-containing protein [Raoultibacter phocaeensis]|uniref:zinc ribbon domain-containing protein n=1 Tax=Raoultibacter phocaeensis TaxID=2479841 RepID=UPI001119CA7D|nr:hypothetical protein [Raoultibacter phocaeensis]
MKADTKDLATLLTMQHLDMELIRAKKKLSELPQRAAILEIRKKRQAVEDKQTKVAAMRSEAEHVVMRIKDEDERLAARQSETQDKIDESRGDYRSVEALSKDLNGIMKRRVALEADLAEAHAKLAQVNEVQAQITDALNKIVAQENTHVASFQEEGGALTSSIAAAEKKRAELAEALPPELLGTYEKTARKSGGIALARLTGGSCSVCRAAITEGKYLQVVAEAPLSTCPACKRMLVVDE